MKHLPIVFVAALLLIRLVLPMIERDRFPLPQAVEIDAVHAGREVPTGSDRSTKDVHASDATEVGTSQRDTDATAGAGEDAAQPEQKAFGNSHGIGYTIGEFNRLSEEELTAFRGIGPATARAIAAYRKQHGPFRSFDELLEVKGIGPRKLEQILGTSTEQ